MERRHIFDNPKNVKRLLGALFVLCVVVLGFDAIFTRKVIHPWEGLFGFYALFGFVACVALVLIAKEMRKVVMRGEDYYDR